MMGVIAFGLAGCLGVTIERTGGSPILDGGTGVCSGTVSTSACIGRTPSVTAPYACPFGCASVGGGPCSGEESCSATTSQVVCTNALGCTWNGASCSGAPVTPCTATYQNATSCNQTPGCYWAGGGTCGGQPQACSTMDFANCTAAPGCTWSKR